MKFAEEVLLGEFENVSARPSVVGMAMLTSVCV